MLRLRDDQWERIREHFPEEHIPESRPGRKPVPARAVLEAGLWILNTGAQWHLLPQCYPNYKTVHRRFQQWCEREVLREILTQLANTLREEGTLDERESVINATFAAAKGGGGRHRAHPSWQRREDPGDCGSPRVAALGQYARRESS
jgi:transposase